MSVNAPTNPQIKDADVIKKLQLYGIYSAFANGKAPSNEQIDVALNSALASDVLAKPSTKLSKEGHELVADLRDVIEKARLLFLSKNEGDLLQDFIWQSQKATTGSATTPGAPVDKDTAKQHGNEALDGLRTLGTLLITNGQFRKLLSDSVILLRDVAGDGAQRLAETVNPDEERLNQIDKPADDNTWHDTPNMSISNLKEQARNTYQEKKPFGREDIKSAAQEAQAAAGQHQNNADALAAASTAGANHLGDKAEANLPQDDVETVKQKHGAAVQNTRDYLGKKMPKERREQTIWRLKKMVIEIQGHPDYQRAIDTLLRLAETYTGHAQTLSKDSASQVKGAHTDDGLKNAEADLKLLLERFANGTSFDDLVDSINQMYRDADRDPELKQWFKDVDRYIRKCLQEQGYIMQDQANDEWNKLYDKGNFLLRERYRDHTNRIGDEIKFVADQYDKDPQNKAFALSMNKLFNDLGTDSNGKPVFKKHLLKDVTEVIVPAFFENVKYIPVPRIEYSDPTADAIIENLVIEGDNLTPNILEFGSDNYWRWARKSNPSSNKNKLMLGVSGIQMDLRDVSYYVKKKQGFPSLSDTGVMDIFLGGTGFSFKLALETADGKDARHFFKVNKVTVDIKHMNIKLKKSKHKLLFNIFKPLLFSIMRPILAKVLEKVIKDKVHQADGFLYQVHLEAQRAIEDAKANPDPENVQNIYSRYYNALQTRLAEGKSKVDKVAKNTQVNVAVTQHDSIFKNISLPGGISSKATEYKELAAKGEAWRSPVFSIGNAPASSSLPKAPTVSRKTHSTAPGVLREAQNVPSSGNTNTHVNGITHTSNVLDSGKTTLGAQNPVLTGSA